MTTFNDGWLIERAHLRKKSNAKNRLGAAKKPMPPVDKLWSALQKETKRQAAVYTATLGDPNGVIVETPADRIVVRAPDGRALTLRVDLEQRKLFASYRNQGGGVRMRKPLVAFSVDADGEPTFNFGGLAGAAGSLLRRLI